MWNCRLFSFSPSALELEQWMWLTAGFHPLARIRLQGGRDSVAYSQGDIGTPSCWGLGLPGNITDQFLTRKVGQVDESQKKESLNIYLSLNPS